MKIRVDIQKQYESPEVHIMCREETEEVRELQERLEEMFLRKLTVYSESETRNISIADVVRIYAASKKVFVRTARATFEVRERLYTLEEELKESGFVRISNSEIVNTSSIEKLDMGLVGTIKMHMRNGDVTYVSRRYVSTIRRILCKTEEKR